MLLATIGKSTIAEEEMRLLFWRRCFTRRALSSTSLGKYRFLVDQGSALQQHLFPKMLLPL
jgi:hypothetical protein